MVHGFLSDTRITNLWLGTTGPAHHEATGRVAYLAVEAVAAAGGRAARGLAAAWRPLSQRLTAALVRRRAIRDLQRLDDAVLRDIGVERDAIAATVDGLIGRKDATASRTPRILRHPVVVGPLRAAPGPQCCPA